MNDIFLRIKIRLWNLFILPFPKLRKRFPARINAPCCSVQYIIREVGQTQGGNLDYQRKVRVSGDYSFCLTKLFCFEANGIGDTWYADQISELAINLPRVLIDSRSCRIHGAPWIRDIIPTLALPHYCWCFNFAWVFWNSQNPCSLNPEILKILVLLTLSMVAKLGLWQ
jgi:hypothetical protein